MIKTKTVSPKKHKVSPFKFEFPFNVLDDKLGKIEWHVEPIKGLKSKGIHYIEKILVWASQTQDGRYKGKVFEIPCFSEKIVSSQFRNRTPYLSCVWSTCYCSEHKTLSFSAYPKNEHTKLVFNVGSSVLIDIYFE